MVLRDLPFRPMKGKQCSGITMALSHYGTLNNAVALLSKPITFTLDGGLLVLMAYLVSPVGAALTIWNLRSQSLQKVIFPDERFFRQIVMSPHGQTFAVDQDPWIEIRETRSGRILSKVPNDDGLTPFVFSNDEAACLGQGSSVVIYDLHNPEKREELSPKGRDHISERYIVFSTDELSGGGGLG